MTTKTFTRSFAGGEIAPILFGRIDLSKYQSGLAKCLNFLVTPQGPIENRPGFEYVIRGKQTGSIPPVLIPFTFNSDQSFALEFGDFYIRFHTLGGVLLESEVSITSITQSSPAIFGRVGHGLSNGQWVQIAHATGMTGINGRWGVAQVIDSSHYTLTDLFGIPISTAGMPAYTGGATAARVYEIASPYTANEMLDMHYVQSADVLTLTHPNYAVRELRRLGATNWTLTTPSFVPTITTPQAPSITFGGPGGGTPEVHSYVVTAVASDTSEESQASTANVSSMDLNVTGNHIDIQPQAMAGVVRFNVYKRQSGLYGFIGQTDGSLFRDDNLVPDMSKTPPLAADPFAIGSIVSVPVTAGGTGYGGGLITGVIVGAGGTGYTTVPTVTATGGDGAAGATFLATIAAGAVTGISVVTPGAGYASPTLTITGGGGTGATATATASAAGTVTMTVTGPPGTGAVIQPVVVGGVIQSVRVVSGGSGYLAPGASVTAAFGGTGATFGTPVVTDATVNPGAVGYYEQRRVFGGSIKFPQNVWTTRSGTESNMTNSIPSQDDDAIRARIVARQAQVVRHIVPLNDLIVLTSGGLWRLSPPDGGPLTPSSISPKQHSSVGASMVQPVMTSSSILYAPARGSHVREVQYKWESQSYRADDASVLSPHLFDFRTIKQLAYMEAPWQIMWAVRDDGVLLGLTYQPEHEVKAWHQHNTQGYFRSVCAIPEGAEDGIYAVVQHAVRGDNWYYIERMHTRQYETPSDAFFVDAGATYRGAPASTISGLWHLEGLKVSILADAGVESEQVVTGGAITLSAPASTVHVGLAYDSDAQTMPMSVETLAAFGQGIVKNINEVALRVYASSNIVAGPSFTKLTAYPPRTPGDDWGMPPALQTGVVRFKLTPTWQEDGGVCVRQSLPLPLTLLSMTLEGATGG